MTAEQAHGERFNQAGMTNGLNAMAPAGASDGFNGPGVARGWRPWERFRNDRRTGESAQKWDEKSGDFYAPSSLKNVGKSTY